MHTLIKCAVDLTRVTRVLCSGATQGWCELFGSLAEENLETWFSVLFEGLLGLASAQIYLQEGVQENSR